MAIYKRGGVWWARFTINGQKFRQSLDTSDRREALNEEKVRIGRASEGKLAAPGTPFIRLKVSEAIERYIADRKPRLAPKTVQTELERAKVINAKLGALPLKRLTAETILAFVRQRNAAGIANSTINNELKVIRGALKRAKLWGVISEDVHSLPVRESGGQ